ncbi:MAG TPA: phosphodiesterase, partial [Vulgatibacter sp.]
MEHLQRRIQKLTSILDVAKAMVSQRDLDALLPMIIDEARRVADADRCSLFLVDHEAQVLY